MYDVKDTDLLDLDEEDFDTVLATDISFTGTVQFAHPFMIKGKVKGTIDATGDLVIDAGAVVEANINVQRLLVKGTVIGNVNAKRSVHVTPSGCVTGDIVCSQVVLENGCFFSGKCSMIKAGE